MTKCMPIVYVNMCFVVKFAIVETCFNEILAEEEDIGRCQVYGPSIDTYYVDPHQKRVSLKE